MPNDEIIIRLVCQDDTVQLRENICSGNTLAEVEERVANEIEAYDRRTHVHLVTKVDGAVVGTGGLGRSERPLLAHRAELYDIVVHPQYQRQGIARRIVERLRGYAASMGIEILEVGCRGGTDAEEVYPRLGFIEWGRLPRGLEEPWGEHKVYDHVHFYMPVEPAQA
jgi:GNAT superfamily N-acetyltransferase